MVIDIEQRCQVLHICVCSVKRVLIVHSEMCMCVCTLTTSWDQGWTMHRHHSSTRDSCPTPHRCCHLHDSKFPALIMSCHQQKYSWQLGLAPKKHSRARPAASRSCSRRPSDCRLLATTATDDTRVNVATAQQLLCELQRHTKDSNLIGCVVITFDSGKASDVRANAIRDGESLNLHRIPYTTEDKCAQKRISYFKLVFQVFH